MVEEIKLSLFIILIVSFKNQNKEGILNSEKQEYSRVFRKKRGIFGRNFYIYFRDGFIFKVLLVQVEIRIINNIVDVIK